MARSKSGVSNLVQNGGKRGRAHVYLPVLLKKFRIYIGDKNFLVDEDEEENKSFSDENEDITSPDLDEPNFNEIKDLKSSIKIKGYILFNFVISSGFISHLS